MKIDITQEELDALIRHLEGIVARGIWRALWLAMRARQEHSSLQESAPVQSSGRSSG